MNEQERLSYLLQRYANNQCTSEEFDELFARVNSERKHVEISNGLSEVWENTDTSPSRTDAEWQALYTLMMDSSLKNKRKLTPVWQRIAIAAMFLVLATTTFLYFKSTSPTPAVVVNKVKSVRELSPGGNKAILTLANGEKIILDGRDNGTIINQTGVSITKTADGQLVYTLTSVKTNTTSAIKFNKIEVPIGGQYQVVLPDGTRIWLNSMSSLKYPINFSANERTVELTGEGYFEVAKNDKAPFKVKTENQSIEVIGTHFNVNAYQDEPITRTTLLEGGVKVFALKNNSSRILVPGQQSSLSSTGIIVKEVDTEIATAWKNGNFMFNNDDLESIMRQISRWYDVDVDYKNGEVKARVFSGSISRFENASQVLEKLELTGLVHFKIEGRRIIVM